MTSAAETITAAETRGAFSLWFAVLAGPVCWSLMLAANYLIGEVFACSPATGRSDAMLGIDVRTWLVAINGTLLAVTLAALIVAVVSHRRLRSADASPGGRARWMATVGLLNSVLFGLVIVTGLAPPLLLSPCSITP